MDTPFRVYGSIQDHGSYRGEVDLERGRDRSRSVEFERAPGWEGSSHAIDPTDPNTVYAAGFYGSIYRQDIESGERAQIVPKTGAQRATVARPMGRSLSSSRHTTLGFSTTA